MSTQSKQDVRGAVGDFLRGLGLPSPVNVSESMGQALGSAVGKTREFLGQVGTSAGTALAGPPSAKLSSYMVPNVYQNIAGEYVQYKGTKGGKPAAVAAPYTRIPSYNPDAPGSINTLGGMLNKNFPQFAAPIQRMMATPQGAQMLGAGVLGAGVLGIGAVAGVAAMQHQRYQQRRAGERLGAQLGVMMPNQFSFSDPAFRNGIATGVAISESAGKGPMRINIPIS